MCNLLRKLSLFSKSVDMLQLHINQEEYTNEQVKKHRGPDVAKWIKRNIQNHIERIIHASSMYA